MVGSKLDPKVSKEFLRVFGFKPNQETRKFYWSFSRATVIQRRRKEKVHGFHKIEGIQCNENTLLKLYQQ